MNDQRLHADSEAWIISELHRKWCSESVPLHLDTAVLAKARQHSAHLREGITAGAPQRAHIGDHALSDLHWDSIATRIGHALDESVTTATSKATERIVAGRRTNASGIPTRQWRLPAALAATVFLALGVAAMWSEGFLLRPRPTAHIRLLGVSPTRMRAKAEIARIRDLVAQQLPDDARAELAKFRARYPDYPLPADLKALQRDTPNESR